MIRRDIARTYPEHDFFKEKDGLGQESLFNVMKAYSLHDREVGYCQGSGFIVGLLLMQVKYTIIHEYIQQYVSPYIKFSLFDDISIACNIRRGTPLHAIVCNLGWLIRHGKKMDHVQTHFTSWSLADRIFM